MSVNKNAPTLSQLFFSFLRLGATAFGGPSMVAYIHTMAVEKERWLDDKTFKDGVALCQMIPGTTSMQAAAYVGLRVRGLAGAAASFIGFGLPAFILMMILSALYRRAHDVPAVLAAFGGLQAIIVAMMANATVSFGKTALKNKIHILIAAVAALFFGLAANPVLVILLCGLLGMALVKDNKHAPALSPEAAKASYSMKPFWTVFVLGAAGYVLLFFIHPKMFSMAVLMFKIGALAFGGGYTAVPFMYHEIVEVRGWLDGPTFMNGIVLGQATPGPIMITATFAGYLLYGWVGGVVATIGIFWATSLALLAVEPHFNRLRSSALFNKAIAGILCSFVGLLLTVTFRFGMSTQWSVFHIILAVSAFLALMKKTDIHWVVIAGTVLSVGAHYLGI